MVSGEVVSGECILITSTTFLRIISKQQIPNLKKFQESEINVQNLETSQCQPLTPNSQPIKIKFYLCSLTK